MHALRAVAAFYADISLSLLPLLLLLLHRLRSIKIEDHAVTLVKNQSQQPDGWKMLRVGASRCLDFDFQNIEAGGVMENSSVRDTVHLFQTLPTFLAHKSEKRKKERRGNNLIVSPFVSESSCPGSPVLLQSYGELVH